jgi:hypothetical protein
MKKISFIIIKLIAFSLFANSQPLVNNNYSISKQFVNNQINGYLYLGSISNNGYGTYGKITATAHFCGQLFIAEFDFYGTYYAGSITDWIEVPIAKGNDWNSNQNFALDVKMANHGAPFEIRLRRLSGSGSTCSGGIVYIKIETNGIYTENIFEGLSTSMTSGYLGRTSGWQFPVMQDRFANSESGMFIKNNGNVGIGSINPSEKLSVNGNIRAKKLIVSQQNWSDYVFYKNYKLRPLNELEKFIQQYQHLPDIPSTKNVQSKGINVGDTQALLLKKIEELTLYIIEQDKKHQKILKSFQILQDKVAQLQKK